MLMLAAWPMDWIRSPTATGFLFPCAVLIGIALVVCILVRWIGSRPFNWRGSTEPDDLNVYEAAYIRGGADRVADAVMAGMFRSGQLEFVKPRRLRVKKSKGMELGSLTHAVHQIAAAGGTVKDARRAVAHGLENLVDGLVERGLVLGVRSRWLWRWVSALPFLFLTVAIAMRIKVGLDRDEEIGLTIILGILSLLMTLILGGAGMRTTAEGRRILRGVKKAKRRRPLLFRGNSTDWAWACGLYGAGALPKDEARELQSALTPGSGGDSSSDGGSGCTGCGGGGCGGGGCGGGCGGCGG